MVSVTARLFQTFKFYRLKECHFVCNRSANIIWTRLQNSETHSTKISKGTSCAKPFVNAIIVNEMTVGNFPVDKMTVGKISIDKRSLDMTSEHKLSVNEMTVGKVTVNRMTFGKVTIAKMIVDESTSCLSVDFFGCCGGYFNFCMLRYFTPFNSNILLLI